MYIILQNLSKYFHKLILPLLQYKDDSLGKIYDELSSGEDYWGVLNFEEMLHFCEKRKLSEYVSRLNELKSIKD